MRVSRPGAAPQVRGTKVPDALPRPWRRWTPPSPDATGRRQPVIVADIVRRSAPSVREHTVLTVAADALMESGLGSLPVLAPDGLLTGVVREGDLLRFVVGTGPLTTQTNRSRDPQWLTTPASPETPAAPPALTESR